MIRQPAEVAAVAQARYDEQLAIALVASRAARAAWDDVDRNDLLSSWLRLMLARVLVPVRGAQLLAARGARPYVARVLAAQVRLHGRPEPAPVARVVPEQLAATAADGRSMETLLYQPAVTAVRARAAGRSPSDAHVIGAVQLDMIVRSEVADAGRVATGVQVAATPTVGYVRMLNPPSCSRCAILAGRFYRWNTGFQRHPRCDCIHIPVTEDVADDLVTDPRAYFDSLSADEQRRIFTNAGAEAIRDGADIAQVVNARRGMYSAGGRRLTREGTRRRGARRTRLMPEQIYIEARGGRDEALRLLNLHGYIT